MNAKFSSTYSGATCTITVDLSEFTARLNDQHKQLLAAAMARRLSVPIVVPDGVRLQRITCQATDVLIEVSLGSLSNGYRMDAIERIQTQVKSIVEPAAESFLELLRLVLTVVAAHEGNTGMGHAALKDEVHGLRERMGAHYDRVSDARHDLDARLDMLSTRLAWVESILRTLPFVGQRFAAAVGEETQRNGR